MPDKLADIERVLEQQRKLSKINSEYWSHPSEVKEHDELHHRPGAKSVRKFYRTRVFADGSEKRELIRIQKEGSSRRNQ